MPKRSPAEQLDRAISALLAALPPEPETSPSPAVARLMSVAHGLRQLPRPEFETSLKSDLQRRTSMNEATAQSLSRTTAVPHFLRPGLNNIVPYMLVHDAAGFIDFLVSAFQGVELLRVPRPDGSIMHAEVRIGDSLIELGDADDQYPARPMFIHLYVADADATFDRALRAGASSTQPVADMPWGDRQGTVTDPFGNSWYVAMPKDWTPGPEGIRSIQPFLHLRDAHKMIPFIESALNAETLGLALSPEGKVLHATIKLGYATFEINEAQGETVPPPAYLHVYVPDLDATYQQALRAGAISVDPPSVKPYGERSATIRDPFNNTWFLATYLGEPNA
jgi:PhnB protein